MNLRCAFCQTPYALGRTEMLAALQTMERENLTHYDAHCPRCRRVTQIPRQKLELAFPHWQEALKEAVEQASAAQEASAEPVAELPEKKAAQKKAAPASGAPSSSAGKTAGSKSSAKAPPKKAPAKKSSKK